MTSPKMTSLEMMRRLIAFDTTSRNSNLQLIDFVRDYLDGYGIKSLLVHDDTGAKANLFATIGPEDKGGICLSGHTDVVPVDGQDWHSDPWEMIEKDGRLYGRGVADMKGFLAVALAAVPKFAAAGLKTPVHLLFSHDEEVGCIGVRKALALMKDWDVKPAGCIVGEPTGMQVTTAHKGKKSVRCHVHGHECHSSLAPQGVNAVEYAAEVVAHLKRISRRMAEQGPFDHDYDVPYTTVHTGVINGGTALNIVPKDCHFDFEFRYVPGVDPEELFEDVRSFAEGSLQPEMNRVAPETGFSWRELSAFPGLNTPLDAEITTAAKSLAQVNGTIKVAYGTEAGLIQNIGIPTVICGPGHIAQAHKPDEYVDIAQIKQCDAFMDRLVERLRK
ncbi:MAG: acetylornithine deacetylase [Rhodospirillaceae bacterium]|nr:MAG: acetylornithine deacetylase [Rhodospirillaceae bacterium]